MPNQPSVEDPRWWWMHFSGLWGKKPDKIVDFGRPDLTLLIDGPRRPWQQGVKWTNPFEWVENLEPD